MIWSNESNSFTNIFTFVTLAIITIAPLAIWRFLIKNNQQLKNQEMINRYGSIYSELCFERRGPLNYYPLFLLRRYLFALSLVFLEGWPILQANLLFLQSLVSITYLIYTRPFENSTVNKLEIFNELTILAVTYPVFIYADPTDENMEAYYNVGWFIILAVVLNSIVNMVFVFAEAIKGFK